MDASIFVLVKISLDRDESVALQNHLMDGERGLRLKS